MSRGDRRAGALIAQCDGCGAPDGVLLDNIHGHREYQCPRCMRKLALYSAAHDNLTVLFREALAVFVQLWGDIPTVMENIEEISESSLADLREAREDRVPLEEVQPLRWAA